MAEDNHDNHFLTNLPVYIAILAFFGVLPLLSIMLVNFHVHEKPAHDTAEHVEGEEGHAKKPGVFKSFSKFLTEQSYDSHRNDGRIEKLKKRNETDAGILEQYGWINEQAGITRIPIEKAMEKTIVELGKKPVRAGNPLPVPVALPSVASKVPALGLPAQVTPATKTTIP
ncbi:MAG: hypothetical protein SGI71_00375 [Verrucomicrobiota bacterium]|nr:hypothetical protein [Verrucomicrobiota bacterium]